MTFLRYLLNKLFGRWVGESIRSWRQANQDAKTLGWNKEKQRWEPDAPPRRIPWEGETAIESIEQPQNGPR